MVLADLPYNGADVGVVRMADVREQMMFDLEVQSAEQPTDVVIAGREVRSGCQNVVDPRIQLVRWLQEPRAVGRVGDQENQRE